MGYWEVSILMEGYSRRGVERSIYRRGLRSSCTELDSDISSKKANAIIGHHTLDYNANFLTRLYKDVARNCSSKSSDPTLFEKGGVEMQR